MGGCNCGKGGLTTDLIQARASYPDAAGTYPLATYPECVELYGNSGVYAGSSLYVVARGAEQEKLFPRTQLAAASTYAASIKGAEIENLPTSGLCAQAVVDTYG